MTEAKPAGQAGTWDADTYLRYAAYRARPMEDLLPRIALSVPGSIYDLGCGPGTLTRQLKDRWPERPVSGIDSSAEMLRKARQSYGDGAISWQQADIATWRANPPAALVFANASLHWLPDHAGLFPRLFGDVVPGGILAVQMPMTGQAAYHICLHHVKNAPRWRERLAGVEPHDDPHPAAFYYDLLAPFATDTDIWETDYHHVLTGAHPVTDWVSGAALVPVLSVLNDDEKAEFIADYKAAETAAYPRRLDGTVLFTMRRLFMVAKRA
ncbi:MAG: methyltransferase domain-containing protein [Rhodospirillaceae bacterium]|nr:MAG: methyltransferase domain-containing protein [Rhodospirillaceae bacterium]